MKCHYCQGDAVLTDSAAIYGRSYGPIWLCSCGAYVGCHKGSNKPLGTLADSSTREARKQAHQAFDPIWQKNYMQRKLAYIWLTSELGFSKQVHIGSSDQKQCLKIVEVCNKYFERLKNVES